jgi:ABC-type phosphate/phosphonate transport system ATPase subunit
VASTTVARKVARVVALGDGRVIYDGPPPDDRVLREIYGQSEEPVCA